jgi:serine protease
VLWLLIAATATAVFAQGLPSGAISGRLVVPPDIALEVEPNDDIPQAQVMTETPSILGESSQDDLGMILPIPDNFVKLEDLYRIQTTGQTQIVLTIATNDLFSSDLDLILLDLNGNLLDASEGFVATEVLGIPAGDFILAIRTFQGASAYLLVAQSANLSPLPPTFSMTSTAPFRPGEVVVKLKPSKLGSSQNAQSFAKTYGFHQTVAAPDGVTLLKHVEVPAAGMANAQGNTKLGLAASPEQRLKTVTLDTIRRLQLDPGVVYAEPNYIHRASRVPNDEFYGSQWHYELINLPESWDLSIGDANVIVAVIDTGVLLNHPDLSSRLIGGFDLISDPAIAADGDGIDPNADDPGDDPKSQSSTFHGTHVAGTIGAATDNSAGVAGVTWQTRIMPLRVLGVGGGTAFDIAQGILYAAGLPNASNAVPPERAHIMNLSLGGPGFSQVEQDAITAARAQGVTVVAAAGNDNVSGVFSPASLDGVISVSAVDLQSAKAPYSNFGDRIDVAAPGGNTSADLNSDSLPDGVLSTLGMDSGEFTVRFYQGTSMAAPHVAGVLALMLAVNPDLTPDDFDQLLAGTHPLTQQRITRDLGSPGRDDIFGHGLIDAAAAVNVAAALAGSVTPPPTGSVLAVSTTSLNFENFRDTLGFEITNAGVDTLNITSITADVPWLSVTPTAGVAPLQATVTVDRAALAPGANIGTITVASDATRGETTAIVSIQATSGGISSGDAGTVVVLAIDAETEEVVSEVLTNRAQDYTYTLSDVPAGQYFVVAGTDLDEDFLICDIEDVCGFFPDLVMVTDGQEVTGVDITLGALASPQVASESAASALGRPIPRRD